jgi:hypothetical protein
MSATAATAMCARQPVIKPTSKNYNKWTIYSFNANKRPNTHIEHIIHQQRQAYQSKNNIAHSPHPFNTRHVIYAVYNKGPGPNYIYVGRTRNNAIHRATQEITRAHTGHDHTPLSRFIRKIGRDNVGVLPLQHVKDWAHSLYFERTWIHRLRTHIRKGRILPTNNNKEHQPFTKRKRTHNKNKTNIQQNDTTTKQKQNLHKKVHWLITYNDLHNQPPPSLKYQNTHKLY